MVKKRRVRKMNSKEEEEEGGKGRWNKSLSTFRQFALGYAELSVIAV